MDPEIPEYADGSGGHLLLIADCVTCGALVTGDPETIDSVWVNTTTRCPIRPDGTPIRPGEPGTAREPVCLICRAVLRRHINTPAPVDKLFPHARLDLIHPRTADPERTGPE